MGTVSLLYRTRMTLIRVNTSCDYIDKHYVCSVLDIAYKFVDLRGSDECDATLTYEEDCTQDGPLTEEETVRATVSEDEVKEESSCEKKKKKRPLEGAVSDSCLAK